MDTHTGMKDTHRAAVEEYLGTVRAVSEEFAEAFRSQTEALRNLTEHLETAAEGDPGHPRTGPDPAEPRGTGDHAEVGDLRSRMSPGSPGQRAIPDLFNTRGPD